MQIVKLNQKVTNQGIFIPFNQLKAFEDKNVEIVIRQSEKIAKEPVSFTDYKKNLFKTNDITENLNKVYKTKSSNIPPELMSMQMASIEQETW